MWNCTHFRHPTDEQLRHVDMYFVATKIICSLSTLNRYKLRQTNKTPQKKETTNLIFDLKYWQQKVFEDLSKHANMQTNPTSSKLLANICFDCARFDWLP